jgi:cell division septal protein FtsQ
MAKVPLNRIFKKVLAKENRLFLYLVIVITFVGFLSVFANKWSEQQQIKKFIITGNQLIPTEEIQSIINTTITNTTKCEIDFMKVKSLILKHPYVSNVYILQKNSSIVEISIEEREPIAILVKTSGQLLYIDKFGKILPYRLSILYTELPIFHGIFSTLGIDSVALESTLDICYELSKEQFQPLNSIISEIIFDKETQTFKMLTNDNAKVIYLGKARNFKNKFEILKSFMTSVFKTTDIKNIEYIDLRWSERVIIKYKDVLTQNLQI